MSMDPESSLYEPEEYDDEYESAWDEGFVGFEDFENDLFED